MSRILYRFLSQLARLAMRSGRWKDLQIIVLRHEKAVLRRQIGRPALNDDDRTPLGAIAASLPRPLRESWIMTPRLLRARCAPALLLDLRSGIATGPTSGQYQ